jgi:hypothetical protein
MKILSKYSIGLGDRFGHQGSAQLKAITDASENVEISPVWNKSNREHTIIGTSPSDVRIEADSVTKLAGFNKPYFVDADHINFDTVDRFIESSDFFTIDVAAHIGRKTGDAEIDAFLSSAQKYIGHLDIPGRKHSFITTGRQVRAIAEKYLFAVTKAWDIYRKIEKIKGRGNFVTEISIDEVSLPQTPVELLFILKMLSDENIPLQTIAPKFSGRFNKGVDYEGDPIVFAKEFESDLFAIEYAVHEFGLPENLKISVHSGSDKFALYPVIGSIIRKYDKGIHLKTAGTTWLEEVIGLSVSGPEGLNFVKDLYFKSLDNLEELCGPYIDVINIKVSSLPPKSEVEKWTGDKFAASIRHLKNSPDYNSGMRQLIHVAYKIAAQDINNYYRLLNLNEEIISKGVYQNIYERHICPLFKP